MRRLIMILLPALLFCGSLQAQQPDMVIRESESHSVFKGLFLNVWSRLRAINPHSRQEARSNVVYTAGIRGAEATETLIQPYWKDDLSQDIAFQAELKQFSTAQQLLDNGQLEKATQAYSEFLASYPVSALAPNALFARSLAFAGLENLGEARAGLTEFVKDNPNHSLNGDAREVLAQLK